MQIYRLSYVSTHTPILRICGFRQILKILSIFNNIVWSRYGLRLGQAPVTENFAYDHVIDVWTANNLYLAYNQ